MLTKEIINNYADVLLWGLKTARAGKYKKGDIIVIRFDREALAVAEALFEKVLKWGMMPVMRFSPTSIMELAFYTEAGDAQLAFLPPGEIELYEKISGGIYLLAPDSLTHLSGVDPSKMAKNAKSKKRLRDILDKHEQKGLFGWTLGIVPTKALARQAKASFKAYTQQWIKACNLDVKDPVGQWKKTYTKAARLKKWLNSLDINELHIKSRRCDLTVKPGKQRRWIGISGHNIPSFEFFLSPDWRGTNGVYFANQPSFRSGNYIKDVRLEFKGGKVISARAGQGQGFLDSQLDIDKGAKRLGEFSLTDKRLSRIDRFMANTLFDENYGGKFGNCHVALGSSYGDTFSGNPEDLTGKKKKELAFNDSALHWDLVNTEKKTVTASLASGEKLVIYEAGEFKGPV